MRTKAQLNDLSYKIIGACIEVHKYLGPGLLEVVYHKCLAEELRLRNIHFTSEQRIDLIYKGCEIEDAHLRYDFLIENEILLEIKSVEKMIPLFDAQILSYMQLQEKAKGILINFNVTNIFKEGQKTFVNDFFRALPDK